jgi:hypothetical protein
MEAEGTRSSRALPLSLVCCAVTHLDAYVLLILIETELDGPSWRGTRERMPHNGEDGLPQIFTIKLQHDWDRGNFYLNAASLVERRIFEQCATDITQTIRSRLLTCLIFLVGAHKEEISGEGLKMANLLINLFQRMHIRTFQRALFA